jgi:hypothetical protein
MARVKLKGQTGVEMEALTAVSVACLTIYDMLKAAEKGMVIEAVRLVEKTGGKSGRQKIGLEGDLVDHADDLADLGGGLLDRAHGPDGLVDDGPAGAGGLASPLDHGAGAVGALSGLAHGRGDFVKGGGGLLQTGGLLLGAARQVVGGRGDLARPAMDHAGSLQRGGDHARQLLDGGVEIDAQAFVALGETTVDPVREVAFRQVLQRGGQTVDHRGLGGLGLVATALSVLAFHFQRVADVGGFQLLAAGLDGVVEASQGVGHLADLVLARLLGQHHRQIATRQTT